MVIGRRTPKPRLGQETVAWRMNKVFDLLKAGKTPKKISRELKAPYSTIAKDIRLLRESVATEHPFIPPKGISNWAQRRAKGIEAIEFAKKVIQGKAVVEPSWLVMRGQHLGLAKEKERQLIAMLKKHAPWTNEKIGKRVGVSAITVSVRRRILVEKGRIPEISVGERSRRVQRLPERKTFVLSKKQRQAFLEKMASAIQQRAQKLYISNQVAFDFANILPEEVAKRLIKGLDWRLQRYKPSSMPGSPKTKLLRFFWLGLGWEELGLKRTAWRKHRKISSIDQRAAEEESPLKDRLKAPPAASEITVEQLEGISRQLNLNQVEKAVLFCKSIGLTQRKIGDLLGYEESNVSLISAKLEKRIETLLSR